VTALVQEAGTSVDDGLKPMEVYSTPPGALARHAEAAVTAGSEVEGVAHTAMLSEMCTSVGEACNASSSASARLACSSAASAKRSASFAAAAVRAACAASVATSARAASICSSRAASQTARAAASPASMRCERLVNQLFERPAAAALPRDSTLLPGVDGEWVTAAVRSTRKGAKASRNKGRNVAADDDDDGDACGRGLAGVADGEELDPGAAPQPAGAPVDGAGVASAA
jgi:hypothetical protein